MDPELDKCNECEIFKSLNRNGFCRECELEVLADIMRIDGGKDVD